MVHAIYVFPTWQTPYGELRYRKCGQTNDNDLHATDGICFRLIIFALNSIEHEARGRILGYVHLNPFHSSLFSAEIASEQIFLTFL